MYSFLKASINLLEFNMLTIVCTFWTNLVKLYALLLGPNKQHISLAVPRVHPGLPWHRENS